jgi:hypothetical protein
MALSCRCGSPFAQAEAMTGLLLEWASYRGSGRLEDVPDDLLGGERAAWAMSDLAALGHADRLADGRWRIAPPVLAGLPDHQGVSPTAVVCGARTPAILARLRDACSRASATLTEVPQAARPDALIVAARTGTDLPSIAVEARLIFQRDAALTLLACLPAISSWPRSPCEMVIGRVQDVKRFSGRRLSWVSSSLDEARASARGFFRIHREHDWVNLLKSDVDAQAEIEISAGRLAVAEGVKEFGWSPDSQQLHLPFALYPPALLVRGLVLCSGILPARDRDARSVSFHRVPPRVAHIARALTGLRPA